VCDMDRLGRNEFIGEVRVALKKLKEGENKRYNMGLERTAQVGSPCVCVCVRVCVCVCDHAHKGNGFHIYIYIYYIYILYLYLYLYLFICIYICT